MVSGASVLGALLFDAIDQVELFVNIFVSIYTLVIFVYLITTWIRMPYSLNPIQRFLYDVVDPYLAFWRRLVPLSVGPMDFSPIIAIVALGAGDRLFVFVIDKFH